MVEKLEDPDFEGDTFALLRPGVNYNQSKAYELIKTELIEKIQCEGNQTNNLLKNKY